MADQRFLDEFEYIYPVSIVDATNILAQQTQSLEIITTSIGSQRWEFTIALRPLYGPSKAAGRLFSHQSKHKSVTPFEIQTPVITGYEIPTGTPAFSIAVAASEGADEIRLLPAGNHILRGVPEGNFIKIGSARKVYKIVEVNLGTSPDTVRWEITPPLINDVGAGDVVTVNPMVNVRYRPNSIQSIAFGGDGRYRPILAVVENVE